MRLSCVQILKGRVSRGMLLPAYRSRPFVHGSFFPVVDSAEPKVETGIRELWGESAGHQGTGRLFSIHEKCVSWCFDASSIVLFPLAHGQLSPEENKVLTHPRYFREVLGPRWVEGTWSHDVVLIVSPRAHVERASRRTKYGR